jgi:hypothetical protein
MQITECPATQLVLPGGAIVHIATQRWALEQWEGEDPPSLATPWGHKPKFAVNASRSCAELAIVHHLRNEGWHGVWVNSFRPRELRSEWFPAPAAKTLAGPQEPGPSLRGRQPLVTGAGRVPGPGSRRASSRGSPAGCR